VAEQNKEKTSKLASNKKKKFDSFAFPSLVTQKKHNDNCIMLIIINRATSFLT